MEIDKFMNSKRLFKDVRNRPKVSQPPMPVTVHINYHPDKHERMQVGWEGGWERGRCTSTTEPLGRGALNNQRGT